MPQVDIKPIASTESLSNRLRSCWIGVSSKASLHLLSARSSTSLSLQQPAGFQFACCIDATS